MKKRNAGLPSTTFTSEVRGGTKGENSTRHEGFDGVVRKSGAGQVNLPFVLLVGGIIVEIVLAGIFTAYFLSTSTLGDRLATSAETAARAAIADAMEQIAVNKELVQFDTLAYTFAAGGSEAEVDIERQEAASTYAYTITAESTVGSAGNSRKKRFRAILVVDKTTGKATLQSFQEVRA